MVKIFEHFDTQLQELIKIKQMNHMREHQHHFTPRDASLAEFGRKHKICIKMPYWLESNGKVKR